MIRMPVRKEQTHCCMRAGKHVKEGSVDHLCSELLRNENQA